MKRKNPPTSTPPLPSILFTPLSQTSPLLKNQAPLPKKFHTLIFQKEVYHAPSSSSSSKHYPTLNEIVDLIWFAPLSPSSTSPKSAPYPKGYSVIHTTHTIGSRPDYYKSHALSFLDGFSIVINNVDRLSHGGKGLNLFGALPQYYEDGLNGVHVKVKFPNVYCQLYVTPPFAHSPTNEEGSIGPSSSSSVSQAVSPHNDDRDVFVLQLYGAKKWTAYNNSVNTKHNLEVLPTFSEQAGKTPEILVPEELINDEKTRGANNLLLTTGSRLYIPRGGVHWANVGQSSKEASLSSSASVHMTLAIPTQYMSLKYGVEEILKEESRSQYIDKFNEFNDSSHQWRCVIPDVIGLNRNTGSEYDDNFWPKTLVSDAHWLPLLQTKLTKESVLKKVNSSLTTVASHRELARGDWCMEYEEWWSNSRAAKNLRDGVVYFDDYVFWRGGEKYDVEGEDDDDYSDTDDDDNEGELVVSGVIGDEVSDIIQYLSENTDGHGNGRFIKVEEIRALLGLEVMDDLSILLLVRVLVQKRAVGRRCDVGRLERPRCKPFPDTEY